jgi:hypothetical protein
MKPALISQRRGQTLLITILFLAAAFISVTVISGMLMVNQMNQGAKITDSAKAIFAADAAMERGFFWVFRCKNDVNPNSSVCINARSNEQPANEPGIFHNGAAYRLVIDHKNNTKCDTHDPDGADSSNVACITATGRSGRVARAFEARFQ